MRTWIIHLLILTLMFGPSSALAERARQRPPKASKKLLKWIVPDWVDVTFGKNSEGESNSAKKAKDISSLLNELNKAGGSANKNKSSGNGSGSKGNGSDSGQTLVFNDDAKNGEQPKEGVGDRGGPPPGGGGDNRPPGDKPIVFDLYWPMCVFFDPSVSDGQANEIVKGTIDKAGACGVNLNLVPITIKANYPNGNPDQFNQMQQASCNMQSIGVKSASTLLVNPNQDAAAIMCGVYKKENGRDVPDQAVAGCAQLRGGGGISQQQLTGMKGNSFGGMGGADGIFPSVIVPSGWNSGVASHEAIGHSQMGWPNKEDETQTDAGLGIGSPSTKGAGASNQILEKDIFTALLEQTPEPEFSAAEGSFEGSGWTAAGCAQIRARALPNKHRFGWNPKQAVYTVVEKDPQRQWDLGKPLWGPIPPGGPPSNPPPIVRNEPPAPPEQDKTKLTMNDEGPKISAPPPPEDDGRHRKRKGGSGGGGQEIDKLLTSLRKKGEIPEDQMTRGKPIPTKGDGRSGDSLVFDDSARKGGDQPSGDAGVRISSGIDIGGGMSGEDGGGGESGGSGSLTFDESAAKGGASGSSNSGSSSSSGDGSSAGSGGNRKPASLTGDFFEKNLSKNSAKSKDSSLDDGFFDSIIKADTKQRKRVKGETLRAKMREKASDARARPAPRK